MTTLKKPEDAARRHQLIATYLFGVLLFCFMAAAYFVDPREITPAKDRILGFVAASLAGFFGYFFAGTVGLSIVGPKSRFGTASVKATGAVALFVLVLWWWFQSASPVHRQSDLGPEFLKSVESLERQINRWSETVQSMKDFPSAKAEINSMLTAQARPIKGALEQLMSQRGLSSPQVAKLRSLKDSIDRQEKSLIGETGDLDPNDAGKPQSDTNGVNQVGATKGIARPDGVSLTEYLRLNGQPANVRLLGFSPAAENTIRLVSAGRFAGPSKVDLFYVSQVFDTSNYESKEFPGMRGPYWTQGFAIVGLLSSEHFYRPLPQDRIQAMTMEFRRLAQIAPLLKKITFLTCSGVSNCDQFLAQITTACRQAGFDVQVEPIPEKPIFDDVHRPKPTTAVFRVALDIGSVQFARQFNEALFLAVDFDPNYAVAGLNLPRNTAQITIAGFPTFDASGRAKFGVKAN